MLQQMTRPRCDVTSTVSSMFAVWWWYPSSVGKAGGCCSEGVASDGQVRSKMQDVTPVDQWEVAREADRLVSLRMIAQCSRLSGVLLTSAGFSSTYRPIHSQI